MRLCSTTVVEILQTLAPAPLVFVALRVRLRALYRIYIVYLCVACLRAMPSRCPMAMRMRDGECVCPPGGTRDRRARRSSATVRHATPTATYATRHPVECTQPRGVQSSLGVLRPVGSSAPLSACGHQQENARSGSLSHLRERNESSQREPPGSKTRPRARDRQWQSRHVCTSRAP